MAEPSLAGMRPEGEKISPDGKFITFFWNAEGREPRDLYIVSATGGTPRTLVNIAEIDKFFEKQNADDPKNIFNYGLNVRDSFVKDRERNLSGIDWSHDSRRLLFTRGGDLFVLPIEDVSVSPKIRRLTRTVAFEGNAQWLADSRRILYQTPQGLFVVDADQTSIVQLTRENGAAANGAPNPVPTSAPQMPSQIAIAGVQLSEDGNSVAYIVSDNSKQRGLFVPNYLDEFTQSPTVRRGWSDQRIQVVKTDGSSDAAMQIKLPAPEGMSYIRSYRWFDDGKQILVDRIDRDTKHRQIFLANVQNPNADDAVTLLDEETEPKWIAGLSRYVEPSSKGDKIFLTSERDGFNHIYLLNLADLKVDPKKNPKKNPKNDKDSPLKQLTKGNWEVSWAHWLPDGDNIIFTSTEASTKERQFYVVDTKTGQKTPVLTDFGMNSDAQVSERGSEVRLLFKNSKWNQPSDLYAVRVCTNCAGVNLPSRLTNTVPEKFKLINWSEPQFVDIPTRDTKTLKAKVYLPPQFDKTKKYPMVFFTHGAGYLQNVINGWNNYYREFMFNHILAQRGFVVMDVDYRGSAGYGQTWRTDVADYLGDLELKDHIDAIDFAVKNYAVDTNKVGIYGGSYGGFMAEIAVLRAPERFACAAALRPVSDWRNYYASSPVYTTERLGFPDKNTEAYKRSSPISYAEKLNKPLLILHGIVDDNVHVQDSMQFVEKLIRNGKTEYFETMFYPSENHGFVRAESWTDEYERILKFFEKNLKN